MRAKCIKADPLGFVSVGEIYDIHVIGHNYCMLGTGLAVNEENFKEMFETIKE